MHYSYLYGNYFYEQDITQMIDELTIERAELKKDKILFTSFVEDFKNKLLGIPRDFHRNAPVNKEYNIRGTVYMNGKVMPSFE